MELWLSQFNECVEYWRDLQHINVFAWNQGSRKEFKQFDPEILDAEPAAMNMFMIANNGDACP